MMLSGNDLVGGRRRMGRGEVGRKCCDEDIEKDYMNLDAIDLYDNGDNGPNRGKTSHLWQQ